MWINCRWKMLRRMQLLRLCLIIVAFSHLICADKSTIERIRKHQEWLKQRNQQRQQQKFTAITTNSNNYLANLWRFPNKPTITNAEEKPSLNEVYPENERVLTTTTTTTTTTTPIPTPPTTTSPNLTTIELPNKLTTATTTTTTTPSSLTTANTEFTSISGTTEGIATNAAHSIFNATLPLTISNNNNTTTKITTTSTSTTTSTTSTTTTRKPRSKPRPYPRWGNWSRWNECSRSCGGGVMYQQRKCISRNSSTGKRYISNDCIGVFRRYHLCNEQACPGTTKEFRAEQCASFNEVDFQGQKYAWEPYIKDDAECELNCKPLGMKYFATLNASVIDGTSCYRPAEYYRSNYHERAMCVGGICKLKNRFLINSALKRYWEIASDLGGG